MIRLPAVVWVLASLSACAPMSQSELLTDYDPVTFTVEGDLVDVYKHASFWATDCHAFARGELFETDREAVISARYPPYWWYTASMSQTEPEAPIVVEVRAWDAEYVEHLHAWMVGAEGCI